MPKVIFVVGTTASGKSDLALKLAKEFSGAIFNADSIQMYRELNIGSAKPTELEMKELPHHLFNIASAPDTITVGDFHREFFKVYERISQKYVFVVGGTGFYFQALEKGLPQVPAARREFQDPLLEKWKIDPESAKRDHQILVEKDPIAAKRIHFNDHYRLARALDLIDSTGKGVTQVWEEHRHVGSRFGQPILKIGFKGARDILEAKIAQRTAKMLQEGLVQEVRELIGQGLQNWEPLRSVGYKQVLDFLNQGLKDEDQLKNEIVLQTLRLAKKQRTWFQRDPEIHWLESSNPTDNLTEARRWVQNF